MSSSAHPGRAMSLPERIREAELADLVELVDQVRVDAEHRGAVGASFTFRTLDGEVCVDWRREDWLKVTLTGDAAERTYVLDPTWGE